MLGVPDKSIAITVRHSSEDDRELNETTGTPKDRKNSIAEKVKRNCWTSRSNGGDNYGAATALQEHPAEAAGRLPGFPHRHVDTPAHHFFEKHGQKLSARTKPGGPKSDNTTTKTREICLHTDQRLLGNKRTPQPAIS